jgi:hypothetical protein
MPLMSVFVKAIADTRWSDWAIAVKDDVLRHVFD